MTDDIQCLGSVDVKRRDSLRMNELRRRTVIMIWQAVGVSSHIPRLTLKKGVPTNIGRLLQPHSIGFLSLGG